MRWFQSAPGSMSRENLTVPPPATVSFRFQSAPGSMSRENEESHAVPAFSLRFNPLPAR